MSRPTNGLAIASIVCGIVGLLLICLCYIGLPLSIAALVMGVVALGQINTRNQEGRGLAITGIVTGIVSIGFAVTGILWTIASS